VCERECVCVYVSVCVCVWVCVCSCVCEGRDKGAFKICMINLLNMLNNTSRLFIFISQF
jgi:hypothetical protein